MTDFEKIKSYYSVFNEQDRWSTRKGVLKLKHAGMLFMSDEIPPNKHGLNLLANSYDLELM